MSKSTESMETLVAQVLASVDPMDIADDDNDTLAYEFEAYDIVQWWNKIEDKEDIIRDAFQFWLAYDLGDEQVQTIIERIEQVLS